MTTTSSQSTVAVPFDLTRFIVLECSVSLFTITAFYLFLSLLLYEWRLQLRHLPTRKDRIFRYGVAMRIQSVIAVLFTLGRLLCEQYELVAQYAGVRNDYCDVIIKIKITFSGVAVLSVYVFLWTRQRFCYSNPAMLHLSNRGTRVLSWITLLFIFLAQIIGTILFLTTRIYSMTPYGCINSVNSIPPDIPWIWVAVATFTFQTTLLVLFVYPLMKHRSRVRTHNRPSFLPVVQRALVTATICIVTDLLSSLLILLVDDVIQIIPTLAYDVSLLTNVICVIASFRDWKTRVTSPFCFRRSHTNDVTPNANDIKTLQGALSMNGLSWNSPNPPIR